MLKVALIAARSGTLGNQHKNNEHSLTVLHGQISPT
jgi:hypothetical protein